MKIVIIDDDGFEQVLSNSQSKRVVLDNDIQSLLQPKGDRFILYKQVKRYNNPHVCKICSRILIQRDARK